MCVFACVYVCECVCVCVCKEKKGKTANVGTCVTGAGEMTSRHLTENNVK